MDSNDFAAIVTGIQRKEVEILIDRGKVYADEDRFRNFKNVARMRNQSTLEALLGMFMKHFEAFLCFSEKVSICDTPYEQWEEKIVDMRNYLTIALGIVIEEFRDKGLSTSIKLNTKVEK